MSGLSHNEFKRHKEAIWPELEREIQEWICDLQRILEDPSDEVTERETAQARGSIRALRNVLLLPEQLLDEKSNAEEESNERENSGTGERIL